MKSPVIGIFASLSLLTCAANAVVMVNYIDSGIPAGSSAPVEATDWADHVTPSTYGGHGGVTMEQGYFGFRGWSTTFDETKYAGFTVSAEPGYEMTLTDLKSSPTVSTGSVTSFKLGYRIDNGSGFGAWTYSQTWSQGDPGFSYVSGAANEKIWDFADITTTGTVEFGLFATSTDTVSHVIATQPRDIFLNGNIVAVPEPSALLLSALACSGLLRRRR